MRISQLSNSMGMANLYLNRATNEYNKSSKRIASGKKLTTDMVGSLSKLQNLKAYRSQAKVDNENLSTAKDFANVKDGALAQITGLAQKISEEYASDTINQDSIDAYATEITNILTNTEFNGQKVFQKDAISFGSYSMNASELVNDSGSTLTFDSAANAKTSLDAILKETSINGAQSNGIDARISVNTTAIENMDEAISRIEDVDIAEETLNLTKQQTLQQLSLSMINNMTQQQSSLINYLV